MSDNAPNSAAAARCNARPEVNMTVTSNVSLGGVGFTRTMAQWFHKFFKLHSETVVAREPDNKARLTVTRVSKSD